MSYYKKFPVSPSQKFGYILMANNIPDNAIITARVRVVHVYCGIGEEGKGTDADLNKIINQVPPLGMKVDDPKSPTCATSMNYWPVAYLFVQSTAASSYRTGEVDFLFEVTKKHFPNAQGKPASISISMGGFITEVLNTVAAVGRYSKMLLMMTGNTNSNANNFPVAAAQAGTELYYYHAINDDTAPPALSVAQYKKFQDGGGKGYYVMYQAGKHGIISWPITAFYPGKPIGAWFMYNNANQAVTADSAKPQESIYDTISEGVTADKLLLTQTVCVEQKVYQRDDGSVYTTQAIK